jgi:DNA-binding PadR family transcriptional regulator
MHLRYAILALLAEGEAHGYQLLKRFNQRLGPFWHPNIGQVYQLLHELERRGFVARRDEALRMRLRRLFRITPRGERALRTWVARRPAWPPPLRDEIFVRFLATEREGRDALLAQLERQEAEYRRYLLLVHEEAGAATAPLTRRLTHAAALAQAEAHLAWIAHSKDLLRSQDSVPAPEEGRACVVPATGERRACAVPATRDRRAAAGEAGAAGEVRAG